MVSMVVVAAMIAIKIRGDSTLREVSMTVRVQAKNVEPGMPQHGSETKRTYQ